jgi:hypothetical protein
MIQFGFREDCDERKGRRSCDEKKGDERRWSWASSEDAAATKQDSQPTQFKSIPTNLLQ